MFDNFPTISEHVIKFYAENLRGSLFSAFMTITGFLFTLHAFLLVTLYREIYGTTTYRKMLQRTSRDLGIPLDPTRQLRNISRLLFISIGVSFFAAISQLTFGLMENTFGVGISILAAALAIGFFVGVMFVFRAAMIDWFNVIRAEQTTNEDSDSDD